MSKISLKTIRAFGAYVAVINTRTKIVSFSLRRRISLALLAHLIQKLRSWNGKIRTVHMEKGEVSGVVCKVCRGRRGRHVYGNVGRVDSTWNWYCRPWPYDLLCVGGLRGGGFNPSPCRTSPSRTTLRSDNVACSRRLNNYIEINLTTRVIIF